MPPSPTGKPMDVKTLTLQELEHLLEEYPWFTLARKEYVRRQGIMGEDALRRAAAEAGIYLLSREEFYRQINGRRKFVSKSSGTSVSKPKIEEPAAVQPKVQAEVQSQPAAGKQKYYVVNGDYFDKEDYKQLEDEGLAFDTSALAFNPVVSAISALQSNTVSEKPVREGAPEAEDGTFCTETLAKIYTEQEFYQRAIDIYEKLILLYPKKSAYFATLIEQIKNIKQQ